MIHSSVQGSGRGEYFIYSFLPKKCLFAEDNLYPGG